MREEKEEREDWLEREREKGRESCGGRERLCRKVRESCHAGLVRGG